MFFGKILTAYIFLIPSDLGGYVSQGSAIQQSFYINIVVL